MFREYPVRLILSQLERDDLLPAILFRTSRKQCDADLLALTRGRRSAVPAEKQAEMRDQIAAIVEQYSLQPEVIYDHPQFQQLLSVGVGAHHAGQLLGWRLLLEELMSRGMLKLLIATGTVAAGVDFPARTVVVTSHSRRGSGGFQVLRASEFQQMAGRAGRRGKDAVGVCIIAPTQFADARVLHQVAHRPPEPLRSAYFAAPSTVLNLLKFRNVDDLEYTVSLSLASFLDRKEALKMREEAHRQHEKASAAGEGSEQQKRLLKKVRRLERDAVKKAGEQLEQLNISLRGLEALGYVSEGKLTEKGSWAAELCTSLVLELGEAIADGIFNDVSQTELAALVGSIAGDPHRAYFAIKANPVKRELYEEMTQVVERVQANYESPYRSEVAVLPNAGLTVTMWLECEEWGDFVPYLNLAGVAPGDVARLIMQTADHLNQISRLSESHPKLAERAELVRHKLLRPPFSDALVVT